MSFRPSASLFSSATKDHFSRLRPSLQLIDFGRCVDLSMFPRGKTFSHVFSKPDLRSPEMLEGRPWSYQVYFWHRIALMIRNVHVITCLHRSTNLDYVI